MAISLPEVGSEYYVPPHYLIGYRIDEKAHVIRSGIVLLPNRPNGGAEEGFKGISPDEWRRERFHLRLNLQPAIERAQPRRPAEGHYWGLIYEQWAATAAPNSMFNLNVANDAGWAVDAATLVNPAKPAVEAALDLDLAISDGDGYLFRVSYYLHIIGTLVDSEIE